MTLSTKNIRSNDENRALRAKFIEEVTPILKENSIPLEKFIPKAVFEDNNETYVKLFPGELGKESDFYIELVTQNYEPLLSAEGVREIRYWKYNPHYKDEYKHQVLMTVDVYLIPILELPIVGSHKVETIKATPVKPVDNSGKDKIPPRGISLTKDAPYSSMTIRDYFAITHKKPVSFKPWLNELINNLNTKF